MKSNDQGDLKRDAHLPSYADWLEQWSVESVEITQPRLPLENGHQRWPVLPQLPKSPMMWRDLRPYLLARAEQILENYGPYGSRLVDNHRSQIKWVNSNIGPAVEQALRLTFTQLPFRVSPVHDIKIDVFKMYDSIFVHPESSSVVATDRSTFMIKHLNADTPSAQLFTEVDEFEKLRSAYVQFLVTPQHGSKERSDFNLPPTRTQVALDVLHEWWHYEQLILSYRNGSYVNTNSAFHRHHAFKEGEAIEVSWEVLRSAARLGILPPDAVGEAIHDQTRRLARVRRDPAAVQTGLGISAEGVLRNRAITNGLPRRSRLAALAYISAGPRSSLGRRPNEPDYEWGTRIRDILFDLGVAATAASCERDQPSKLLGRIWPRDTVVQPPYQTLPRQNQKGSV